jgi:hypothetical protein
MEPINKIIYENIYAYRGDQNEISFRLDNLEQFLRTTMDRVNDLIEVVNNILDHSTMHDEAHHPSD